MLSVDEIRRRIDHIASLSDDPETAHSDEDGLHTATLAAIASGAPNAKELAQEALRSREIEFPRWCA